MRRCSVFVLLLFLLASPLLAQQPGSSAKSGTLSGLVVDSTTSHALKRATVHLTPAGQQTTDDNQAPEQATSAVTDEQGRFEFKDVPPGNYRLRAEHPGFVAVRDSGMRIRLRPGQNLHDLAIRLAPAAVISGRIVNEHGEPMPGVRVEALRYAFAPGGRQMVPADGSSSDDQGEYRIFDLSPGHYYVRAKPEQSDTVATDSVVSSSGAGTGPQMRYPATYYPGVTRSEEASSVDLHPGDQASIDFDLVPVNGVRVRGHLPAGAETDLGTAVMLLNEDGVQATTMAQHGTFELRTILPGTYTIVAEGVRGEGAQPVEFVKTIQVGEADMDNVELGEGSSPPLTGMIRGEVRVANDGAHPNLSQLTLFLTPADLKQRALRPDSFIIGNKKGALPGVGQVHKDGTFSMGMPMEGSGTYFTMLTARGTGLESFYSKSVIYGGKDITETGLALPASSAPLEIVIAGDGATVQGSVIDEKNQPVDSAIVIAIPTNPKLRQWTELYQPATTDQNGQFTIRGLRPGEYHLFAWEEIDSYAFLDPEFMRPYESRGQELKAEANGRYNVVLHILDAAPPAH